MSASLPLFARVSPDDGIWNAGTASIRKRCRAGGRPDVTGGAPPVPAPGLEPEIEGWQAKLRAAEDGGGLLRVIAGMRAHGVHVAPGPLDGVAEIDSAAAAGLQQAIDGPHAPLHGLGRVPPIA